MGSPVARPLRVNGGGGSRRNKTLHTKKKSYDEEKKALLLVIKGRGWIAKRGLKKYKKPRGSPPPMRVVRAAACSLKRRGGWRGRSERAADAGPRRKQTKASAAETLSVGSQ